MQISSYSREINPNPAVKNHTAFTAIPPTYLQGGVKLSEPISLQKKVSQIPSCFKAVPRKLQEEAFSKEGLFANLTICKFNFEPPCDELHQATYVVGTLSWRIFHFKGNSSATV